MKKKLVVLGHFGVGKTSLTHQFVKKMFSDKYLSTIGVSIHKKNVEISPEDEVQLIIWDIAGEHNINLINKSYLKGAHGYVFVTDLTREETFKDLTEDITLLNEIIGNIPYVLVGNKLDLLNLSDAIEIQEKYKLDFLCSAKTGEKVEAFFKAISIKMINE